MNVFNWSVAQQVTLPPNFGMMYAVLGTQGIVSEETRQLEGLKRVV